MNRRRPKIGEIYRHFKGKEYKILCIALCTETKEEMVVYESLQGEKKYYVSSIESFMRELDHEKYPGYRQVYRFELSRDLAREHQERKNSEEELILEFLDLDENEEKAEFLQKHRGEVTDRFLTVVAESLEFAENSDTVEERYAAILRFLRTKIRYESRRLR